MYDTERPAAVLALSVEPAGSTAPAEPAPGLLAVHVHPTRDGDRAFVVSEWADAAAHEASGAAGGKAFARYGRYR
ncbi:antibiotic biosynthesis monooxygenase [Streptomyces sp. SID11385]|uniref:antibiotic biosynthesis monooxygenase n=1 Tax=Streptomyces sp. SID11385 TaxID=2706031 RepID=UPI0013CA16CB|nr:antibiotic biosynthesis monooxygenase [Streptomyces sp. SID11385]NEA39931.1 hypothetical protein [Streptomyces sp. SID11385]